MTRSALLLFTSFVLSGCVTAPPSGPTSLPSTELKLNCPVDPRVQNAAYVGPYRGVENLVSLLDQAQDIHCSDMFKNSSHDNAFVTKNGYVTIYGSSRIGPCPEGKCVDAVAQANHDLYAEVHQFAFAWTQRHGKQFPVMTGAGPGLMEAGSKGAKDAGGPSIGYTTYYDPPNANSTADRYWGGDATKVFNSYVTSGLIFSSVAIRESAMIKHSAAIVLAPGGTGTEWEIFQILETIKSKQLRKVGVYVFGDPKHWKTFEDRLNDMYARGVVKNGDLSFKAYAATAKELLPKIAADLGLPP